MKFLRILHRLLLPWGSEQSAILMACGFGLYLWIGQSFTSPGAGPALHAMNDLAARLAPEFDAEAAWGSVLIGAGLLALLGLITWQKRVRQIAAVALIIVWGLMAWCFWSANHRSPGCWTWLVFALMAAMSFRDIDRRPSPFVPVE